ncbi:MAG: protein arginine kinase [Victivallales bacterium]|nr:protein arginine kinase [Victivallales bacterium]
MNERIDTDMLLGKKVSWLADSGPEDDIAISTRIRLARNVRGIPFPTNPTTELSTVMVLIEAAVEKTKCLRKPLCFSIAGMEAIDKQILLERRLISNEFSTTDPAMKVLVVNEDEDVSLMVNEEDHLRLQAMHSGLCLMDAWKVINEVDGKLSAEIPFAFDRDLGYLTSCPTNVGTGMRASVMLHLPGLVLAGQVRAVIHGVNKLGLEVRGIFGEGSDNLGNLCQISNQSTLGESEESIIKRLQLVVSQIITHEKNARRKLWEGRRDFLLDSVGRAYGVLNNAFMMNSNEALNSLSLLRLGVDMKLIKRIDIHTVNELFILAQPAHLQKYSGVLLEQEARDVARASLIREKLKCKK